MIRLTAFPAGPPTGAPIHLACADGQYTVCGRRNLPLAPAWTSRVLREVSCDACVQIHLLYTVAEWVIGCLGRSPDEGPDTLAGETIAGTRHEDPKHPGTRPSVLVHAGEHIWDPWVRVWHERIRLGRIAHSPGAAILLGAFTTSRRDRSACQVAGGGGLSTS